MCTKLKWSQQARNKGEHKVQASFLEARILAGEYKQVKRNGNVCFAYNDTKGS